jgi:hypothetical protein
MRILDHTYKRETSGLKGAVRQVHCETIESSGDRRTDFASYDEGGLLREEIHQLSSAQNAVKTTFTYEENSLVEEKTYSGDRLLNTTTHIYTGGLPALTAIWESNTLNTGV